MGSDEGCSFNLEVRNSRALTYPVIRGPARSMVQMRLAMLQCNIAYKSRIKVARFANESGATMKGQNDTLANLSTLRERFERLLSSAAKRREGCSDRNRTPA
jgi:hypothetical protein